MHIGIPTFASYRDAVVHPGSALGSILLQVGGVVGLARIAVIIFVEYVGRNVIEMQLNRPSGWRTFLELVGPRLYPVLDVPLQWGCNEEGRSGSGGCPGSRS